MIDFSQVKKWFIDGVEVKKVVNVLDSTVLWQAISRILKEWRGLSPLTCAPTAAGEFENIKVYGNSKQQLLPDGYTQLDYIETTGTQYIDTGIYGELESELKFVGQVTKYYAGGNYGHLWGDLSDNTRAITFSTTKNTTASTTSRFGNTATSIQTSPVRMIPLNETVTVIENKEKVTSSNGIEFIFNATEEFTTNKTLALFCVMITGGIATARHNFKCFYFSHKKNGVLVQELIPARRNSDDEIGMYDTVNNIFLTNAGTGEFIAGPVAPTSITPIEIESVGDKTKNLFDKNAVISGYFCRAGNATSANPLGSLVPYDNWYCSDYIQVKPNTTYTLTNTGYYSSTGAGMVFFADKTVESAISGIPYNKQTQVFIFTTPENCNYLRFCLRTTMEGTQLEEGAQATPYESYGYKVPVTVGDTTTNIYLNEPLRKIGEYADTMSVDGTDVMVVRNVEVIDETGTKTIEESLIHKVPSTTETYTIDTPINALDNTTIITVDTTTKPSEIYASEYIEE